MKKVLFLALILVASLQQEMLNVVEEKGILHPNNGLNNV